MNHIRTYHYYWHIFFFSLLVCMAEFTKAADRDVLERVIYLAKSIGYGALYLASFVMICDIECVSLMFVSLYIHQSLV